jgi:hypothetical protein
MPDYIPGEMAFMFSGWKNPAEVEPPHDKPVACFCREFGMPDTIWFCDCGKLEKKSGETYLTYYLAPEYYPVPKTLWHPPSEVILWALIEQEEQQMRLPL